MPSRIIREGLLDSETVNRLSDRAERLFVRLLIAADDAGRCDARAEWLAARLFPTLRLRSSDVQARLDECVNNGLLTAYIVFGRPYVQVMRWQRQGSAKSAKYPNASGSLEIEYISSLTHEGEREFVKESMPIMAGGQEGVCTGSLPGIGFSPHTPLSVLGVRTSKSSSEKKTNNNGHTGTVEEWLKELQNEEAYKEMDVPFEYSKMLNWCKVRRRQPTRRRFINWLNNADRPIAGAAKHTHQRPEPALKVKRA